MGNLELRRMLEDMVLLPKNERTRMVVRKMSARGVSPQNV